MKVNDLMVGDWLQHASGKYFQITRIDMWGDGSVHFACGHPHLWEYNNEFSPIPLTAEILEKNGFEKTEEASYERVFIWFKGGFELNGLELVKLESWNWYKYGYNVKIRYVHQLQHLLRLCNIEKEIIV